MKAFALAALVLAVSGPAVSAQAFIVNEYRAFSDLQKGPFVAGAVDGFRFGAVGDGTAPVGQTFNESMWFYAGRVTPSEQPDVHACIDGWSVIQVRAAFDRYIGDHPEVWYEPAVPHLAIALVEACDP